MKAYKLIFAALLLNACTHQSQSSDWLYQSPDMDVRTVTLEIPEFDKDKWVGFKENQVCSSYLYKSFVNADGELRNPTLLYADEPRHFQAATEDSLKRWKLKVDKPKEVHFEILYGKSGGAHVVFLNDSDANSLLSSLQSLHAVWKEDLSTKRAVPLKKRDPDYPREMIEKGGEGFVVVQYKVGKDGKAKDMEVVAEFPKEEFQKSALQAMSKWSFQEQAEETNEVAMFRFAFDSDLPDCYINNLLVKAPDQFFVKGAGNY